MQQICLEQNIETDFYCPATGDLIVGSQPFTPSSATLFAYLEDLQEFEFATDSIRAKFSNFENAELAFACDTFEDFLNELDAENAICFTITQTGMACGPMASRVHIGIQMNQEASSR